MDVGRKTRRPRRYFGEVALLDPTFATRTTTARSVGYSELMVLGRDAFNRLCDKSAGFATILYALARERLERNYDREAAEARYKAAVNDKSRGAARRSDAALLDPELANKHAESRDGKRASDLESAAALTRRGGKRRLSVAKRVRAALGLRGASRVEHDDGEVANDNFLTVYDILEADIVDTNSRIHAEDDAAAAPPEDDANEGPPPPESARGLHQHRRASVTAAGGATGRLNRPTIVTGRGRGSRRSSMFGGA